MSTRLPLLSLLLLLMPGSGCTPRTPLADDADRRQHLLREIIETRSYSSARPSRVTVTPQGDAVLFLRPRGRTRVQDLHCFDVASGRTRRLVDSAALLGDAPETLSAEEQARRERQRIRDRGIASFSLSDDGAHLLIPLSGKLYIVARRDAAVHPVAGVDGATDARFSPDGRLIGFVKDYNLHVCDWRTGTVTPVTQGGTEELSFGVAEFVAQEEMGRHTGYWWSPDSATLVCQETDNRPVEKTYIADAANPANPPRAWAYPRAGGKDAVVRLGLFPAGGGTPTWIAWDRKRYPYLASVCWTANAPLTLTVQSGDQRELLLLTVDPSSGATTELLREQDPAWINLVQSMPHWFDDGSRFLWMSEADGEWRLWLHAADGSRIAPLNPDDSFRLRRLVHLDEPRGVAIVAGAESPVESHLYELPLGGGPVRKLTEQPGVHWRSYGKGHDVYVEGFDGFGGSFGPYVRGAYGRWIGRLADAPPPPFAPNVELTRVGPNREFDASIVRPRNFVPGRKYPVIVYVYGGPGGGVVHAVPRAYYLQQWYADQGFIVVASDNRGIDNRGRAWERAIQGNFGDLPLDDQVTALQALGRAYPELDLTRVGIMGWSFGGYLSALAVCKRGDVFHAAAAGAPVTDWTLYDTHYTQRYLGTPQHNPDGYKASSVLTYADRLRRPLLLIHGTADDNVHFAHSLKLADALFARGIPFEFLPLPGRTHIVPDPQTRCGIEARIAAFFRQQLTGQHRPAAG